MNIVAPAYSIEPIRPGTVDRAYPMARVIAPSLKLTEWRRFCRDLEPPREGRQLENGREEVILALNRQGYAKGLCIYSVRDHWSYGKLLDVPVFVVASAADTEGIATELLHFLRNVCHTWAGSGVRFWSMGAESWERRRNLEDIRRSDHGIFVPALASVAEMEKALSASGSGGRDVIERLSR